MTKLYHTIKENNDTITMKFKLEELEKLPIRVAMKTLEILEENNKITGYFVEFTPEVKKFIDDNKELYKEESAKEIENFKKLSKVYFDEMSGPLYVYGDRVLERVEKIYEIEPLVWDVKVRVPKITHTLINDEDSECTKVLAVKNIQELIDNFGKAITLHTLVLFKEHLNYDYQVEHKVAKSPYGISNEIKKACFNHNKGSHELLEPLTGKNYFFDHIFDYQMKNIKSPEEILELIIIKENLKNCLNNPEDKYEVKKSNDDIWYVKNNIIHRDGDLPAGESKSGPMFYKNGLVHRDDDLPYAFDYDGSGKSWAQNGHNHRDGDLPATISNDGRNQYWQKEGEYHRVGKPAIIKEPFSYNMGQESWWIEGKTHREDGPAITYFKSKGEIERQEWWIEGKTHREDGPAIISYKSTGEIVSQEWWLSGLEFSEKDFAHELSKRELNQKLNEDLIPLNKNSKKKKI